MEATGTGVGAAGDHTNYKTFNAEAAEKSEEIAEKAI
jgi:hypothetical protein